MPAANSDGPDAHFASAGWLSRRLKWLLVATFFVTFGAAVAVIGLIHENHIASVRLSTQMLAQGYAQRIQERLQTALASTYVLASAVKQAGGDLQNFNDVAAELITLFPGVNAMQLAPDGIIRDCYPLAGNEASIGHDLLADRKRNREAVQAITTQQLTLAGPFKLIQGGIGAAGRLPVFLTNERNDSHFWGFAIALIRIPNLLDAAGFNGLTKSGYRYELWRIHPETEERDIFARSDDRPLSAPVEYVITVYNGRWILSLAPEAGWVTTSDYIEMFVYSLGVAGLITLLQYAFLRTVLANRDG